MEWWEAPELDRVLWRGSKPNWGSRTQTVYKHMEKFADYFPLSGNYSEDVKERSVWRKARSKEYKKKALPQNGKQTQDFLPL